MWSKKELIDKRSEFWAVLARGATLQAACDAVGGESTNRTKVAAGDRRADPAQGGAVLGPVSVAG
jgi:hypothetical protein